MAAGSRLLGCTKSPGTRLARVSLPLDQESISRCLCFPFLFVSVSYRHQVMVYYLSYFSCLDPISLSPLLPSRSLSLSLCLSLCVLTQGCAI